MAKEKTGSGSLFPKNAHGRFMEITSSRYGNMMRRLEKKGLALPGHPPFTLDEFRKHILAAMNGQEDGFVRCRYCLAHFGLEDLSPDHEIPLSRRGSTGLDNIGYPCSNCNQIKGSLKPNELLDLLTFLEEKIPEARTDVLGRLAKAVTLAAGVRATQGIISDLKRSGAWKEAQKERRERKKAKESGLGRF